MFDNFGGESVGLGGIDWSGLTADADAATVLNDSQERASTGGWLDSVLRGIPQIVDSAARYENARTMGTQHNLYATGQDGRQYTAPGGIPAAGAVGGMNTGTLLLVGGAVLAVVLVLALKK